MDRFVSHSFVNNYGHCHLCGTLYKEGWLDENGEETCNPCKQALEHLDDLSDDQDVLNQINPDGDFHEVMGVNDYWDEVRKGLYS